MKIAILNKSGNVGKTTIATSLFLARMPDADFISVESTNIGAEAEGIEAQSLRGKEFKEIQDRLLRTDSAIIDVGSSNVDDWLKYMQQYQGSHEEFDYFVIPVINDTKIFGDTIRTIRGLKALGVEKKRIRVVFNRVDTDDNVKRDFSVIFGLAEAEKNCIANENAVVYTNQVYEMLKQNGISISVVLADETDYRSAIRNAKTDEEKDIAISRYQLAQVAKSAKSNLDSVFAIVTK